MKLSELLAEIGRAGATANQAARREALLNLAYWFKLEKNQAGKPRLVPRTVPIHIEGACTFDLPLPTAVDLRVKTLERLEVELETDLDLSGTKPSHNRKPGDVPPCEVHVGLKRGLRGRTTHATIRAVFRAHEPPEGIAMLQETLNDAFRQALRPDANMENTDG